ncbi:MAG: phage tail protein [Caldimonas sp.]
MSPSKRSSSPTSASSSSDGAVRGGPLGRSNFVVDWGGGASAAARGFAEVIFPPFVAAEGGAAAKPGPAAAASEDAAATERHLVLRRGATGALDLYDWWDRARHGQAPRRRVVTVRLLAADHSRVVMTWRFRNARPVSLAYSPLLAMDAGVLMETIAIAFDTVEMV